MPPPSRCAPPPSAHLNPFGGWVGRSGRLVELLRPHAPARIMRRRPRSRRSIYRSSSWLRGQRQPLRWVRSNPVDNRDPTGENVPPARPTRVPRGPSFRRPPLSPDGLPRPGERVPEPVLSNPRDRYRQYQERLERALKQLPEEVAREIDPPTIRDAYRAEDITQLYRRVRRAEFAVIERNPPPPSVKERLENFRRSIDASEIRGAPAFGGGTTGHAHPKHGVTNETAAEILNNPARVFSGRNRNGREVDVYYRDGSAVITEAGRKHSVITAYGRISKRSGTDVRPEAWSLDRNFVEIQLNRKDTTVVHPPEQELDFWP